MSVKKGISAREAYLSPEFVAFCKRFGINHEQPTTKMVLTFKMGPYPLKVTQTYIGDDLFTEPQTFETTNMHNKDYHTYEQEGKKAT